MEMRIEKLLTELKKDRRVDKAWIKKLSDAGIEIGYGKYNYWDNQPYVKIGESIIFLVETFYNANVGHIDYIKRNEAIERIRTEADDLDEKDMTELESRLVKINNELNRLIG